MNSLTGGANERINHIIDKYRILIVRLLDQKMVQLVIILVIANFDLKIKMYNEI